MITGFYSVFKDKYDKMHKRLNDELKKEKSSRDRKKITKYLNELKGLKKALKKLSEQRSFSCPHCGKEIKDE